MSCSLHVLAWPNRRSRTDPISLTAPGTAPPAPGRSQDCATCSCLAPVAQACCLSCMGKYSCSIIRVNDLVIFLWAGHGDRMNVLWGEGGLEGLIRSLFSPARKSISVILNEIFMPGRIDRKSTRLNSSNANISYADF